MLAAVTGADTEGSQVRELLASIRVDDRSLFTDQGRVTTFKRRLLGRTHQRDPHHIVRLDREDEHPLPPELAEQLLSRVRECVGGMDLVVISDYNKGVCKGTSFRGWWPWPVGRRARASRPGPRGRLPSVCGLRLHYAEPGRRRPKRPG